jgi:transcriptional regulator with XRE-family HTH domain
MKTIYHPGYVRLVRALKQRRMELGLSQQAVATRLGCCRTRVVKIEQRELRLDVLGYWNWCSVLKMNPGRLMGLLGKKNPPA